MFCVLTTLNLFLLTPVYPKKSKILIQIDIYTSVFISVLFIMAKIQKQPMYPSIDDWIRKMWCIYTMEYYSAVKRNEMQAFATTWMNLEGSMLSELGQKEKDKYHMITLICGIQRIK